MHVAVDGSPLIEQPYSPSSLHLIEWLSMLHSAGLRLTLLYPRGRLPQIPPEIKTIAIDRSEGGWGRLRFQQRDLPRAVGDLQADLLIVGDGRGPLASPKPFATISSLGPGVQARGLIASLTAAAGQAGSRGAIARLHPSDVATQSNRLQYAPFVSGAFSEEVKEEREAYVLCHGFNRRDIPMILSAWTWVDGSLGDSFPLTFLGAEPDLAREIDATAAELDIEDSVRVQPEIAFEDLPRMYGSAAAFIGTAFKAAGQTLRWALAAGAPVVGPKTDSFKSVLGSAAYLVPPDDSRSLGAACLTVLIQERVSEPLRSEGFIRAGNYLDGRAGAEIVSILRDVAKVGRRTTEHGK